MTRRSVEADVLPISAIKVANIVPTGFRARILVVSDVRLYREALAARLAQDDRLEIVGVVDHSGALRDVGRAKPDLVLLDTGEWHGLDLATTLLKTRPDLAIVAIGIPKIAGPAFSAMCGGIAGFVPRDGSLDDVIAEVDRLTTCGRAESIPIVPSAPDQPVARPSSGRRPRVGELTPRECEILQMIELGLSNKEIARDLGIEVGTVKNHVHNILDKLKVCRRNQAAHRLREYAQEREREI